ncbi:xanthine dehydrogenase family Fe-S subunit [Achromobacter xylosoxidans]|uniref:Carbon monoxide dehydrogenase n=1 Tax=Alcaligenes xylosoxydans xylosoxydans TaxID=85698 RepID=A0A424W767_ALCXX|nr:2Fe-2S iron-sulfur cluster-binding protein [Achromobacter xylosoxidans]MBC9907054.1 2Fe-2S iron-sulfur cluster binding domain-containing protein [Achromobacter xylosoxidans]MBD0871846.1 2Fe-2S iron-sulfur cluster binding domain-containing protein [Achromobacter xylosoxidans]QNP83737.1 2Fe-2S iron-sulfur cluster binding domain-containing protein [Achromobacter xylosoxidans]RPJ89057.1 carbon monoxide dehydrogenase [Achromobacter xylosoxidans]
MSMVQVTLEVNGKRVSHEAPARMHLGDFLRDQARLTGTHLGCEHGVCGACTVLVDGAPVRSCISFAVACEGRQVTTIEGYDADPVMQRLRAAFTRHHALQCGYCTPGMLATSRDIVLRLPDADEGRVRVELSGNLCRCTGYMGIVAAVMSVLAELREQPDPAVEALRAAQAQGRGAAPAAEKPVAFAGFTPAAASHPAASAAAAPAPAAAPAGRKEGKKEGRGSQIDGGFKVPFPAAEVWAFMVDLPALASCLPGASIEEHEGDRVKGKIAIKFGPMSAAFNGAARLERDDAAMQAVFRGAGQDSLSQSRANGDITYRVEALSPTETQVHVNLLYSLQGPLAQFSRSGLVQDFVRRMIADFGNNVTARLRRPAAAGEAPVQASFNPTAMFFSVLWARIKRWFGRGG